MFKNKIVNFTCYDAGAAEIISNFIKFTKIKRYNLTLGNLAKKIFIKNKVRLKLIKLKDAIKKSDIFITGTSWKYSYELKLINKISKLNRKKSIVILDDFINLKNRFLLKNNYIFPDELWIPNNIPRQRINSKFLKYSKIKIIKNYYLNNIKKDLKNLKKPKNYKKNLLFLSQPIRDVSNKFTFKKIKYDELDYLKKLLLKLNKFTLKKKINLFTIRLHPAEKKNKYNKLINDFKNIPIELSKQSLLNDITRHRYVFGMNTNAMKIAIMNKNVVISLLDQRKIEEFFFNQKIINFKKFNFYEKQ